MDRNEKYQEHPQKGIILTDDVENFPILDFSATSDSIINMITNSYPKFSVGIYGEWGTGKTTLMRLIESSLQKSKILTVWFNAWQYEKEKEFALIPLLRTIANKIPNEERYGEFKNSIKKGTSLVKKHLPQIATSLISDLATKFIGTKTGEEVQDISDQLIPKIETLIHKLETESVYYDGIENIAEEITKIREKDPVFRLVVIIDDLDRCSPEKVLEVLESIKLFLGLDGFIYVIGLSHETLSNLISQKYPGIKGEEYIKKMIQVPIHLPKWDKGDILKLITNLMSNNLINPKYENFIEENKILISDIVEPNPRELKRFINNFTAICEVFNSTHNKIIPIELLLIQALSIKNNLFYQLLVTSDADFRRMVFDYAKLPTRDENYLKGLDKDRFTEEFKAKIKEYDDNLDLWNFIHTHEEQFSKITRWDVYRRAIYESQETLESKIRTEICFEFRQDKGKFKIEEFDSMARDLVNELKSNNITISSRGFMYNWHTVCLGVIEPYLRITPELLNRYEKGYTAVGVVKVSLKRADAEPKIVWQEKLSIS